MNILKIKIHLFSYIILIISILNGFFKDFFYINLIIIIHEFGHILMAKLFKWKIEKIVLLPFGAITIFNEKINRPLYQEFLIAISGPMLQFLFFNLFFYNNLIYNYNLIILFLNLLPIIPFDGSKILNIIFNKFFSFKTSLKLSIYLSFFIIFILFIINLNNFNLTFQLFLGCSLLKTFDDNFKINTLFNKFLYERYQYNFKFKKRKIISKKEKMMRDYYHIFNLINKRITEKDFLNQMFDFSKKMC